MYIRKSDVSDLIFGVGLETLEIRGKYQSRVTEEAENHRRRLNFRYFPIVN